MMIRGFLSKEWKEILRRNGTRHPEYQMSKILKIVWEDVVLPIWEQRNEIQHSKDSRYVREIDRKLNEELRWFFRNKDSLAPGDRFLLPRDLNSWEKVGRKVKKRWIKRLNKLKAINVKERDNAGRGQKKITRYFRKESKETERGSGEDPFQERRSDRGRMTKQGRKKSGKEN